MRIDAHHHFWNYDTDKHSWITDEMSVLKADFLPAQLRAEFDMNAIDACVSVQATQSEGETIFLNELAEKHGWILGIVGWIDLLDRAIQERLEYFSTFKKIKGWRHVIQSEKKGFMEDPRFLHGISKLSTLGYTYDILIYPHQIKEAVNLVRQFPYQKFVVDHLAKPNIKDGEIKSWANDIRLLSQFPNVSCKVSGMVTEANWFKWQNRDFVPYLDVIVNCFGTHRILYGSDWPVCLLSSSYSGQLNICEDYFSSFSQDERLDVFGNNAIAFYALTKQ